MDREAAHLLILGGTAEAAALAAAAKNRACRVRCCRSLGCASPEEIQQQLVWEAEERHPSHPELSDDPNRLLVHKVKDGSVTVGDIPESDGRAGKDIVYERLMIFLFGGGGGDVALRGDLAGEGLVE